MITSATIAPMQDHSCAVFNDEIFACGNYRDGHAYRRCTSFNPEAPYNIITVGTAKHVSKIKFGPKMFLKGDAESEFWKQCEGNVGLDNKYSY